MTTPRPLVRYLTVAILSALAADACAAGPLALREIDADLVLPAGWSLIARKPVDGRPGFVAYTINNGQAGNRSMNGAVVVGATGVPASRETLAKMVGTMLDMGLDTWRRLKSLGEAREVQRAATEIEGMTAGFSVIEIACPPLFDGPPDIVRVATFAALDEGRSFVCTITVPEAGWSKAWPAFKQMVNSLRVHRE